MCERERERERVINWTSIIFTYYHIHLNAGLTPTKVTENSCPKKWMRIILKDNKSDIT